MASNAVVDDRSGVSLSGIDLNLLVALDALLTECHVTRAAERVNVGQPAMSASLARLRRHFDDQLLVRQGRYLVRTPMADSLVGPVRDALTSVEVVMARRRAFDPSVDDATFTIATTDYVTLVLLRPLLRVLTHAAPQVRLSTRVVDDTYAAQLRRGDVDLVILPRELVGTQTPFSREALFVDRFVLVVDRDHPWVGDAVDLKQMGALNYASYKAGWTTPIADVELESAGVHLRHEVSTASFAVAPFLVSGTELASITFERLALQLAEAAHVKVVEFPLSTRKIHEEMYWSSRHAEDPPHRWLRQSLRDLAAQL
jgi:DNA-binding transcriptional LysR family regulator